MTFWTFEKKTWKCRLFLKTFNSVVRSRAESGARQFALLTCLIEKRLLSRFSQRNVKKEKWLFDLLRRNCRVFFERDVSEISQLDVKIKKILTNLCVTKKWHLLDKLQNLGKYQRFWKFFRTKVILFAKKCEFQIHNGFEIIVSQRIETSWKWHLLSN